MIIINLTKRLFIPSLKKFSKEIFCSVTMSKEKNLQSITQKYKFKNDGKNNQVDKFEQKIKQYPKLEHQYEQKSQSSKKRLAKFKQNVTPSKSLKPNKSYKKSEPKQQQKSNPKLQQQQKSPENSPISNKSQNNQQNPIQLQSYTYNPPKYKSFNPDTYKWKADIDYRQNRQLYRVGKGEQGVLTCEPYKSQIGQFWRFKNPEIAQESSKKIYQMFEDYVKEKDFIGADMARKYLQMGFTRARRYANFKGGLKYSKITGEQLPRGTGQDEKSESASIFYEKYKQAQANEEYVKMKKQWRSKYG